MLKVETSRKDVETGKLLWNVLCALLASDRHLEGRSTSPFLVPLVLRFFSWVAIWITTVKLRI